MGFKILRLKYDLIIRHRRQRPAQLTDLLVIRQMFRLNYILKIPEETTKYDETNKIIIKDNVDKKKYLNTMKFYLKMRYYINLSSEQIDQWLKMNFNTNQDGGVRMIRKHRGGMSLPLDYFNIQENQSELEIVYPSMESIIKMGYSPNIIIYSSDKPYLYEGEQFTNKYCFFEPTIIKKKHNNNLRVATFNVHNFITRCNQGVAPIFETGLNPFENPRDINRFIEFFKKIDADILCLQELVPINKEFIKKDITDLDYIRKNFNFKYLNELMETIGYKYRVIGSTQQGNFLKTEKNNYYYLANGIYSKIKFKNNVVYNYNFLNRNIISIDLLWNNKNISLFNTHWEYYNSPAIKLKGNHLIFQSELLYDLSKNKTDNIIICGDFNINIYQKGIGKRYSNWEQKTRQYRSNFNNTNNTNISTNFSQMEQTDFILLNKNSNIKTTYSHTVKTDISDHYCVITDFV
jgi:endonuclease/exonuclease/phosphatase family metal-dependent hydrolase